MAVYMKFGDIRRQVKTEGFKDWIELTSFQAGVRRGVTAGAGAKVAYDLSVMKAS